MRSTAQTSQQRDVNPVGMRVYTPLLRRAPQPALATACCAGRHLPDNRGDINFLPSREPKDFLDFRIRWPEQVRPVRLGGQDEHLAMVSLPLF